MPIVKMFEIKVNAWFALVLSVTSLFISNANAHDYSAALSAAKSAAYKQTGAEDFTNRLGTYVLNQVPYNRVLVSGYGAYKMIQAREIHLKISGREFVLRRDFVSVTTIF